MEPFIAIHRVSARVLPGDLVEWASRALESISQTEAGSRTQTMARSGAKGVVACRTREQASDVFFGDVGGKILYVHGCVEPIMAGGTAERIHLAADKVVPRRLLAGHADTLEPVLQELTGSFHLAIFDPRTDELIAATDRLNSRPIFVYVDAGCVSVTSDIRAILALPQVDAMIDVQAFAQFVRTQTVFGSRTLYTRIASLMPATLLTVDGPTSQVRTRHYWALAPLAPFASDDEAVEQTADSFRRAATRITKSVERGGVLLSGGLDSRLMLALISRSPAMTRAYTFGPTLTDEGEVAKAVARAAGVRWELVTQSANDYWSHLAAVLPMLQGQYSIAHTHPFKTAGKMARDGIDTIYHGLELCVTFSGSYLPKHTFRVLNRRFYDYRLQPIRTVAEVKARLLQALDIQEGRFRNSYLQDTLRTVWRDAAAVAVADAVEEAAAIWPDPYDQYEKAILHAGFAKFRSYSVATGNRLFARERTLMPDAEVIDAYRRLSVRQRFLGPVYRQSFRALSPELARIVYANIGTSPFASPARQAIALQTRQFRRATVHRVARFSARVGLVANKPEPVYGSYPSPADLVRALGDGASPGASAARTALVSGALVQSGMVDGARIDRRLRSTVPMSENEATTLLALATLACWLERYPGDIRP